MCRQCFSQPSKAILNASSCRSISGQRERHVLYQRLFRLALWETSSSCSSSQLSTWFMETWAISRLATQSSPDKLVPSAHVTVVCFLQPIFIHDNKLNMPCFWGSYFFSPPFSFSPCMTCSTITRDLRLTQRNELHKTVWHVFVFPPRSCYE